MTAGRRRFWSAAIHILPTAFLLCAIWLPFGFSMTGLIEEWDLLGLYAMHGTFFVTHMDGPLAANLSRPLMPLAFGLSHLIAPDSFLGFHLLTMASMLVKGAATSFLVSRATRSYACGVLAAILLLLYPADTMQFALRSVHIHLAGALALLGAALLLWCLDFERSLTRNVVALAASSCFLAACLIYEAALALWPLPLALVWVTCGARAGIARLREAWGAILLWVAAPMFYACFAVWAARSVATYQSGLISGQGISATLALTLPKLFPVGALRAFLGGWVDAARILLTEYVNPLYVIATVVVLAVVVGVLWRGLRREAQTELPSLSFPTAVRSLRLIAGGSVLMLIGYAPFLASGAHVFISQRTFIWASPGAVLMWVGILFLLAGATRWGAALAGMTLSIFGLAAQLYQFHHYATLSDGQKSIMRQIVQQWDGSADGKTLVVVDGTNAAGHTWMLIGDALHYALSYVYGHRIGAVEICHKDDMEWQRWDSLGRKGTCFRDDQGWTFRPAPPLPGRSAAATDPSERRLERRDVVAVEIEPGDGDMSDASRQQTLEQGQGVAERRYRGALQSPVPFALTMFKDQVVGDRYHWDFGDYWSLEVPPRGSGWREAEWSVGRFNHNAASWKTREDSHLFFDFTPKDAQYQFVARIQAVSPGSSLDQLKISLNGVDLKLQYGPPAMVLADIPRMTLKRGRNHLEIRMPIDKTYYGLSLQFDSVEVRPLR